MIKKFYFENFKGFVKTELYIENLTTLIGTNASGKSNAIEGMLILSEMASGRNLTTILDGTKNSGSNIRGGARGCCRFDTAFFKLGCTVQYDEISDLYYEVKINTQSGIYVEDESLVELRDGCEYQLYSVGRTDTDQVNVCYSSESNENVELICVNTMSIISQLVAKLPQESSHTREIAKKCASVINSLKNILFLNPDTTLMRNYASLNDSSLKVNASNISSALYQICKNSESKKILMDIMRKLPENEVKDISFAKGPLNDVILFLDEIYGQRVEKMDAVRLSDGTLRCLAISAALLSEKTGSMIVIEEIDNGIHPGRAKMLIKAISEISWERQIDVVLTTHNAVLLNGLSKEDLTGVNIIFRNNAGAGDAIRLLDIPDMPILLANGKLGDVFTNDKLLEFIKKEPQDEDYSWLEV